jgi:transcriptional regulator with XRE-family HTH domain
MSRWKQLPTSPDSRVRQLVIHLRRAKDHSGLSLEALAARTGYSRSSWDRYLNGKALPPQQAVAALAHACDTDPARLLALHEVAVHEVPVHDVAVPEAAVEAGGDGDGEGEDGDRGGPRPAERRVRRRWVLVSVSAAAGAALAALTVLVAVAPSDNATGNASAKASGSASRTGEFVYKTGQDHPCTVRRDKNGLLYAGYSRTRTALIGPQSAQWPVVEAQCLLRHHGFSPGIADGLYGPRTERAVERMQDRAHLVVDGVVGEDTWRVLRK